MEDLLGPQDPSERVKTLSGHEMSVSTIAWSPHTEDGTNEILATFVTLILLMSFFADDEGIGQDLMGRRGYGIALRGIVCISFRTIKWPYLPSHSALMRGSLLQVVGMAGFTSTTSR